MRKKCESCFKEKQVSKYGSICSACLKAKRKFMPIECQKCERRIDIDNYRIVAGSEYARYYMYICKCGNAVNGCILTDRYTCIKCGQEKSWRKFAPTTYQHPNQAMCHLCTNSYRRSYYAKNKIAIRKMANESAKRCKLRRILKKHL